jgi:hypothetical protein
LSATVFASSIIVGSAIFHSRGVGCPLRLQRPSRARCRAPDDMGVCTWRAAMRDGTAGSGTEWPGALLARCASSCTPPIDRKRGTDWFSQTNREAGPCSRFEQPEVVVQAALRSVAPKHKAPCLGGARKASRAWRGGGMHLAESARGASMLDGLRPPSDLLHPRLHDEVGRSIHRNTRSGRDLRGPAVLDVVGDALIRRGMRGGGIALRAYVGIFAAARTARSPARSTDGW